MRAGISFGGFQMDYKDTNLVGHFPISPVVRVEPCFGVMLYADEFVAYRWVLSYTAVNQLYKSSYLGIPEFEGVSSAQSRKQIGWLNVGFTVVYYLHKPSEESQGEF
jgi:hypothetical protein